MALSVEMKQKLLKDEVDIKFDAKNAKDINDNPFNYEDERYKVWKAYFKTFNKKRELVLS